MRRRRGGAAEPSGQRRLGRQPADQESGFPSLSRDGRFVAFTSDADNLVPNDTNHFTDVFVHDMKTGATERVNVDSSGGQADFYGQSPSISADGRFVAFASAADNLVAGDANGTWDVFVRDRQAGTTELASVDSNGVQANNQSWSPSLSADGRFVAFTSYATNLVAGGTTNVGGRIYLHDRATGATEMISVDSSGHPGDQESYAPSVSGDGRFVAFASKADDLVANDTNFETDVFLRDCQLGTTVRLSVDASGNQFHQQVDWPSIAADGSAVAMQFDDGSIQVKVVASGALELASVDSSGNAADSWSSGASLSADGRFVAFSSLADNLTGGVFVFGGNVFIHDRKTGVTTWCSAGPGGGSSDGDCGESGGSDGNGEYVAISPDGTRVAFWSDADDLVAGDVDGVGDVFVHGAPLTLTADPESAAAGVQMTFEAWTGKPGAPVMLVAMEVDGAPTFLPVVMDVLDGAGDWSFSAIVPFGLTGHLVTLEAFSLLPNGKVGASEGKVVTFL